MNRIKFVKETDEFEYCPDKKIDSIYQICQIKKPGSKVYETRKVFFNEQFKILKVYEKEYTAKIIKKFIQNTNTNRYKIYPVSSLSYVEYPNSSDMSVIQSSLTNK